MKNILFWLGILVSIHPQVLSAEPLFFIDKPKLVALSKIHIDALYEEIASEDLKFMALEFMGGSETALDDRLKVVFCVGAPVKSKADTFDLLAFRSVKPGYIKIISVEVSKEGIIENAKTEELSLAQQSTANTCVADP